uniref:Microsomal glutathione S-transferase 1 n=1 Tax=Glossina brevipalpis TaxID=37001 RepID=A0A2C9MDF3_9MUSC
MSTQVSDMLTLRNDVFKSYLFWSAILVLKMMAMSVLTAVQRFSTHTFANPEDCLTRKDKVKYDEAKVERVRRAHLNDLENILPFLIIGFLYVLTDPSKFLANNLFRAAAFGRVIHTLVYAIVVIPQPARVLSFAVAYLPTAYMAFHVLSYAS